LSALVSRFAALRFDVGIYDSGISTRVHRLPGRPSRSGGSRGLILRFSHNSRRRLRRRLLLVPWRLVCSERRGLWCTFTARSGSAQDFKVWFRTLWKRVIRRFPRAYCTWRLEYQQRGVAHLHVLVVLPSAGQAWALRRMLSRWWLQVAVSGDPELVGQCVRRIRSIDTLASYVSDASKVAQSTPPVNSSTGELELPGRWWGVCNRECELAERCPCTVISGRDWWELARNLISVVREHRYAASGHPRVFDRPALDSCEFFDPSLLF